MDAQRLVKVSKYLPRHLRHESARLGLELRPAGSCRVDAAAMAQSGATFYQSDNRVRLVDGVPVQFLSLVE